MKQPRLLGVLVTYRRPDDLRESLIRLGEQTRRLDRLVVVDNAPTAETEAIARDGHGSAAEITYLPLPDNAGFPGGLSAGMASLLGSAEDQDWIVVLDDDDPPDTDGLLDELLRFAEETSRRDPRTAAVGLRGARFDRRRGLLLRVPTREINEAAVAVDCIAGNALPLYRAAALRDAGTFDPYLFFSHEELAIGLRLQAAGYALFCHGALWRARRAENARPDVVEEARWRLLPSNWRSYYSLRNTIYILRSNGHAGAALRISISRGLLKPLAHMPFAPRSAAKALRLNCRACLDAWRGKMGRRVEPDMQPRPKRPTATPRVQRTS